MIKFEKVSKRYSGGVEVFNQLDFSLGRGEMAFLTGPSGSGKSTFLKLIAKLEQPSSGQIWVNGQSLNQLTSSNQVAFHRRNIGLTFQNPSLLFDRTVFNNVALPLWIQGESLSTITKRVHAALDLVNLLDKQHILPIHLSCGEQQRVGLARSIVHKPPLLLADEPTGNLDPCLSQDMMKLFEQFNQVGVSVLVATHDLALIAGLKHKIVVLKGAR